MFSIKTRKTLSVTEHESDSSSDSDAEEPSLKKIVAVPSKFRARKDKRTEDNAGLFIIDTAATDPDQEAIEEPETSTVASVPEVETVDKRVAELLDKAVCGPRFEKSFGANAKLLGFRATKRARKEEQDKTNGKQWFDMPATELTDETRMDLELLQNRSALDSNIFYRKNDRSVLPKYFQIGHVVDAPEDYYSSRMTKKERKKTMVDELLNDMDFMTNRNKQLAKIKAEQAKIVRGGFHGADSNRKRKKANREQKLAARNDKDGKTKKRRTKI